MNIPPFPSQDLAKLVLGYLAEEQLMTAYDEFLQASPYLDAFGNEYDRIFMTSLKNILAEYRAVKIYVETCQPFHLRRKLFQCSNLLEMVKFLIQHIDISRILDGQETKKIESSAEKHNINEDTDNCEVCKSSNLETCTCSISRDHNKEVVLDRSVETTALSDLPGNHTADNSGSNLNAMDSLSTRLSNSNLASEITVTNNGTENNSQSKVPLNNVSQINVSMIKQSDPAQEKQNSAFNQILNQDCCQNRQSFEVNKHQILMGGYKNFALGVNGGASETIVAPDTRMPEKVYVQIPVSVESSITSNREMLPENKQPRTQYLLKVAHINNTDKPNKIVPLSSKTNCIFPKVKPKADMNKVKILSDVKVEGTLKNNESILKMPAVLKNATSTPLLEMQTIVINGTPVYKQKPMDQNKNNYTKDEIMAMPTIILAPAPGPPSQTVGAISSQGGNLPMTTNQSNLVRSLSPLTIEVTNENGKLSNEVKDINDKDMITTNDKMPKILDCTSASAPKHNTAVGTTETGTPQVMPPIRKSSSTPRRTSHVRVLDFATPRRILHESVNKCVSIANNIETVKSRRYDTDDSVSTDTVIENDKNNSLCGSSKENDKNKAVKKSNWDADLRALAVISKESKDVFHTCNPTPKCKTKKEKKKKVPLTTEENVHQNKEKQNRKKRTTKGKSTKNCISEPPEEDDVLKDKTVVPVKPTINIITGVDRGLVSDRAGSESDKSQNKTNQEKVDTPEMERMCLQNEIGAKLNISDLLETPYKQALYDIQMETPRFLDSDLPGDPMSDIKIMNIPTPKFLNAPTPLSYSSRPTDYSSGGSYYKPDDQDYMRISDDLICPMTSSVGKESMKSDFSNNKEKYKNDNNDKNKDKPTRPVRQCAKNVSYYNSSNVNTKTKGSVDKTNSSFSDMTDNSFCDSNVEDESKNFKSNKENKVKNQSKTNTKVVTKKRKSPGKKEGSKSFMKIKPRRLTPSKKDNGRRKRKTPECSKVQGRKKVIQKEGNVGVIPVIALAPTKSRRKSSTPRKLHCTKSFNSESSDHDSPELLANAKENMPKPNLISTHDSDTEQLPLRWSDDGSQDVKSKEIETNFINESEDISKIQEYLKMAVNDDYSNKEGCLHIDLVKRGFDLETAKIIERELLDTSPHVSQDFAVKSDLITSQTNTESIVCVSETKSDALVLDGTLKSDCSTRGNLQIVQDDNEVEESDEIELSIHECNQDTGNFFIHNHDDIKDEPKKEQAKLKDKFSMEVCLDDDLSIRLRATPFSLLLDEDPDDVTLSYNEHETEMAVRSITNPDKLYTPLKQSIKAQCFEIFDSTLTSLDTPLKPRSPKFIEEVTVTEIVLEVENIEVKEKLDTKKRKRPQSGDLSDENEIKKVKPEAQYLLNSANIQNIDIESVLSKLHGP